MTFYCAAADELFAIHADENYWRACRTPEDCNFDDLPINCQGFGLSSSTPMWEILIFAAWLSKTDTPLDGFFLKPCAARAVYKKSLQLSLASILPSAEVIASANELLLKRAQNGNEPK